VEEIIRELDRAVPLQGVLGYLNFSAGRPDPRVQKTLNEAYAFLRGCRLPAPWRLLYQALQRKLAELQAGGTAAFRDCRQAEAALRLTFERVLPAYRAYHADLLFHQSEDDLWQPFFLARVLEAVLAEGPLSRPEEEVVRGVLNRLNDYVGHRPIALLESRPQAEPYPHERVRPIPLYLRGAGVAAGRYHDLVAGALDILQQTERSLLEEACFDLEALEELAFDPRAYDHSHPANKRPNYIFGEWDPHHLDSRGRYCRFVVRQITLEALLDRLERVRDLPAQELLFEAAAALAGTILMAAGVSGAAPDTHDSSVSLAKLIPRIASYRDRFYEELLARVPGSHGERLRQEAAINQQPFGGVRQHLNLYLARHRALQLQQRHLAVLFAVLGYPEASRQQAQRIPAASVRLLSEIHVRLTSGLLAIETGNLAAAAAQLPEIEDLLQRGIACGALPDPWNVLGFQGLYPLFTAPEDSVRDTRIDELLAVMEQTFLLYARLCAEAAALGEVALGEALHSDLKRLADWWDRFATYEVSDVRSVRGAEVVASAAHVALALTRWRQRGQAAADLAFWRQHLEGFRSPKAFALVVEALLAKEDYRAAQGLLMSWLSQADQVPLEDGPHSFHTLALRWMLGICRRAVQPATAAPPLPASPWELAVKFLDQLEANAEDYGQVPRWTAPLPDAADGDEDNTPYAAAYEGMTYEEKGTTLEGEVAEAGFRQEVEDLAARGAAMEKQLHFIATLARLWAIAARLTRQTEQLPADRSAVVEPLQQWLRQARRNYQALLALLDTLHDLPVPEPTGSTESLVEYNRFRDLKEHLLHTLLATCVETALSRGTLHARVHNLLPGAVPAGAPDQPAWEPPLLAIEEALWQGQAEEVRRHFPSFIQHFRQEPLLYVPLAAGGHPRPLLRAGIAQTILRALAANLPRAGLLRETLWLLGTAQEMELAQPTPGFRVSEFGRLFQIALQAAVEAALDSLQAAPASPIRLFPLLERLVSPFLHFWQQHCQTFLVASLELVRSEADWVGLCDFIRRYGRDLFHVRFLAPGNLRGILQRGLGAYLSDLKEHPDPLQPLRLAEELDEQLPRERAERYLQIIIQTILENYEEYKDYSATAPHSDYGDQLYILLDFLRLKAQYERYAWQIRPLVLVHEVLARRQPEVARLWEERLTQVTQGEAERLLRQLAERERRYGLRLRTVADRLGERFVKPLAVDRLCALVPLAVEAAGKPQAEEVRRRLEEELQPFIAEPEGVGFDPPSWLRRLEAAVGQARAARTEVAVLIEELFRIPKVILTPEELLQQLE
jgi:hypothetical protein